MSFTKRIICCLLLALVCQNAYGRWRGNDLIELKGGFWYPNQQDYQAKSAIGDKLKEEYDTSLMSNFIAHLSYGRYLKKDLLLDFNIGLAELEQSNDSDDDISLKLIPLSISISKILGVIHSVQYKVGAGFDYLALRGEVNDETYSNEFGGYHLKFGLRYFIFTSELKYSVIDRFGKNKHNYGGWTLTAGLAFQFFLF